ncbi:MAG: hypothetical protein AAGA73_01120 [Pseudomonadota bacterium]
MSDVLIGLVDAMIPGDDRFPKASEVGVHGVLTHRLRELRGPDAFGDLLKTIGEDHGIAAIRRIEQGRPDLFATLRMIVYIAYYEQPAVILAVRSLGHVYNEAPQPKGYDLDLFDPAIDLPDVKGHYVPTSAFDDDPEAPS